jgi:hypothetical protein
MDVPATEKMIRVKWCQAIIDMIPITAGDIFSEVKENKSIMTICSCWVYRQQWRVSSF